MSQATMSNVYEAFGPVTPAGRIDELVFARLAKLGIEPRLCSDAVFVRRAYLDVIGTLPTAAEARAFLDGPDRAGKRRALIDRLLERDEFADHWAMKWGDILRIKAEFPVNLWPNAAQAYHRWVRASIAENKPYDRFARELLTSSGSNFRVGPVNFYRAIQNRTPEGIAAAVALTLMGARADRWPKETMAGMAAFFSEVGYKPTREWKEEVVFWDPMGTSPPAPAGDAATRPATRPAGARRTATFPDGRRVELPRDRDPREVFADWLITPKNKWFTRNVANRAWAWLVGRGVVHEPDDIRDDNPPSNPALLAYLEEELVRSRYDVRHLFRLILNSRTYQASSLPVPKPSPEAEANFARYPVRRLPAEVLIDAINKVTGTTELYTSAIPEPFTYIPQHQPAISIADGSITSPFLTLFGRSARATGMESERSNKVVPAQWLHLLNSSHIQGKLEQSPNLRALAASGKGEKEIARELYLTILSRHPTAEEVKVIEEYGAAPAPAAAAAAGAAGAGAAGRSGRAGRAAPRAPAKRREQWVDIAWAMINSAEFVFRH